MNRKGFAITTVIYGLTVLGLMIIVILMGLLSSTRNNVVQEAERIEQELIAYNKVNKKFTQLISGGEKFEIPKGEAGWYRIEAFGEGTDAINGKKGAYTTGIIYLKEGLVLKIKREGRDAVITTSSDKEIMRADGDNGGTLKNYTRYSKGGKINYTAATPTEDFRIRLSDGNLIGSESSNTYGNDKASVIAGYPGGGTGAVEGLYFVDGLMIPATNPGSSKVIIQKLAADEFYSDDPSYDPSEKIPGRNKYFNNVESISIENKTSFGITVYYSSKGNIISISVGAGGATTKTISPGCNNIDDISIIFNSGAMNQDITGDNGVSIVLKSTGQPNRTVYTSISNNEDPKTMTVTPTGVKLSAYQPDYNNVNLPKHGDYLIIPVNSESQVLSARESNETDSNPITIEYFTSEARQKWAVDVVTQVAQGNCSRVEFQLFKNIENKSCKTEYRIMELSRFKSVAIYKDENIRKNYIAASQTFQSLSRNEPQIWNIISLGDGTYGIKTVVPSSNPSSKSGFLAADTSAVGTEDDPRKVMIGTAHNPSVADDDKTVPTAVERFRFYALNFIERKN